MYNEKYGNTLGIIDDDFNKEQMYRIYYFIKNNCDDENIQNRIKMINLDKPKTLDQQLSKLEGEHNNGSNTNDSKMIPITFAPDSYGNATISPEDVNIEKLLDMGGYIHVIVDVGASSIDIPLLFDKKNLFSYDSYEDMPVYIIKKSELICFNTSEYGNGISFKILYIRTDDIRLKEIDKNDLYIYIDVYDLNATNLNDKDKNITTNITNVYFEPKTIPNANRKEER